jgi:hypothetical protein
MGRDVACTVASIPSSWPSCGITKLLGSSMRRCGSFRVPTKRPGRQGGWRFDEVGLGTVEERRRCCGLVLLTRSSSSGLLGRLHRGLWWEASGTALGRPLWRGGGRWVSVGCYVAAFPRCLGVAAGVVNKGPAGRRSVEVEMEGRSGEGMRAAVHFVE